MAATIRRDLSAPSRRLPRRLNSMLSRTVSQGKQASSWNTTPTPSGTSVIVWPSNATLPSVAVTRPAISSSIVDLPQPDGPTTAKNSPRLISRLIGPSACTPVPPPLAGNILVTPRSVTCAADTVGLPPFRLLYSLDVVRQELGVDHLGQVELAVQGPHAFLHLDDPPHAFEMDLPGAPIGNSLRIALGQIADRAARDLRRDVEIFGDQVAGLVGIVDHELYGLAAGADHGADEVAVLLDRLAGCDSDDVVERRQRFGTGDEDAILVLVLRP